MTSKSQFYLVLIFATLVVPNLAVRDFGEGLIYRTGREILQACDDVVPFDTSFGCTVYASLGFCDNLEEQYCKQSCNKCDDVGAGVDVSCEDVVIPGLPDCNTVVTQNLCQDASVQGIYCNVSCGVCGGSIPPSPPPTTGSVFAAFTQTTSPTVAASGDCGEATDLQCDIEALFAFKNSVIRGFSLLSSWDERDVNPCGWRYVTCDQVDGVNERVTELDLDFEDDTLTEFTLTVALVPEFSKLRYVNKLVITGQNVTGTLPKEFSTLDRLQEFQMKNLELSGNLPGDYSVWSLLEIFIVRENKITGTLPAQLSSLKFLKFFDVVKNQLTGTLPLQYMEWADLTSFSLWDNQFSGSLPAQYSAWENCLVFFIPVNQFSGTLPAEFSMMSVLQEFAVSENELSGSQPAEYSTWKFCNTFITFDNFLTGALAEEYSAMSRMENFLVRENRLTGTLPTQFSEWGDCTNFQVADNRMSGTLPVEYSKMRFLETFYVYDNSFISGTLPVQYSTMKFIEVFAATDTRIQGNIPEEWLLTWSSDTTILF